MVNNIENLFVNILLILDKYVKYVKFNGKCYGLVIYLVKWV